MFFFMVLWFLQIEEKGILLVVGGTAVLIRVVVAIVNIKTLDYLSIVQDTE